MQERALACGKARIGMCVLAIQQPGDQVCDDKGREKDKDHGQDLVKQRVMGDEVEIEVHAVSIGN